LAELESQLRARYFDRLRGRRLEVLVEAATKRPGRVAGTACRYAPVELSGTSALVGHLVEVEAGPVVDGVIQAS
jgi:tRNA A37 methylthiotransferase MiaB